MDSSLNWNSLLDFCYQHQVTSRTLLSFTGNLVSTKFIPLHIWPQKHIFFQFCHYFFYTFKSTNGIQSNQNMHKSWENLQIILPVILKFWPMLPLATWVIHCPWGRFIIWLMPIHSPVKSVKRTSIILGLPKKEHWSQSHIGSVLGPQNLGVRGGPPLPDPHLFTWGV